MLSFAPNPLHPVRCCVHAPIASYRWPGGIGNAGSMPSWYESRFFFCELCGTSPSRSDRSYAITQLIWLPRPSTPPDDLNATCFTNDASLAPQSRSPPQIPVEYAMRWNYRLPLPPPSHKLNRCKFSTTASSTSPLTRARTFQR